MLLQLGSSASVAGAIPRSSRTWAWLMCARVCVCVYIIYIYINIHIHITRRRKRERESACEREREWERESEWVSERVRCACAKGFRDTHALHTCSYTTKLRMYTNKYSYIFLNTWSERQMCSPCGVGVYVRHRLEPWPWIQSFESCPLSTAMKGMHR